MKKILYLECYSGISGDMTVASLLDLGADRKVLGDALASLQVDGYQIRIGRTCKCGIDACDFDVILDESACVPDHEHDHGHDHGHLHAHEHRNIADVYAIIDRMEGSGKAKELARKMFRIVAEAEAKAHGLPIEQVHFHEVGAVDSIVDIISTAVCFDNLGIDEVVVSPLYEGTGHARCQHGILPVPVPAVANISAMNALPLKITDNQGEMVTPTGAAIAAALRTRKELPEQYRVLGIGIGAGKKDFPRANILRSMLLEEETPVSSCDENHIWVLETNVDDSTGEALGFTMECLLEAGARDVFYTPVYMKKNRPAVLLRVICTEDKVEEMEDLIFAHTTTVGIRKMPVERAVLDRRIETVNSPYGPADVKICTRKGKMRIYPEYESIKKLCKGSGEDFQMVYHGVLQTAMEQIKGKDEED